MNLKLQTDSTKITLQTFLNKTEILVFKPSKTLDPVVLKCVCVYVCVCVSLTKNCHKSYEVVKYDMTQIGNRAPFVGCNIYNATLLKITLTQ